MTDFPKPPQGKKIVYLEIWQEFVPSVTGWQPLNLSAYIPAEAICDFMIINSSPNKDYIAGLRKTGSTMERTADVDADTSINFIVAAGVSATVEAYTDDIANIKFILVGYWVEI